MATPFAVPLLKSSNLDCSQVRVPSANAGCMAKVAARGRRKKARATFDKFRPREWGSDGLAERAPGGFFMGKSFDGNGEDLRSRDDVVEFGRGLAHRRFALHRL